MMEYTKEQQEQLQLISSCTTIDEAVEKLCAADSSLTAEQAKAILANLGVEEIGDEGLRLVTGGFIGSGNTAKFSVRANGAPGVKMTVTFVGEGEDDDDDPDGD